jgi:hypothetical protein
MVQQGLGDLERTHVGEQAQGSGSVGLLLADALTGQVQHRPECS